MPKHVLNILFLAALGWYVPKVSATHIVGGELNYKYLRANRYEIRMTIYRDTCSGRAGFDNPASLGVFNYANTLVLEKKMTPIDSGLVPPILYDPCTDVPRFLCYKYCHYVDTIILPPLIGGYQLVYQRCCRVNNIANIIGSGANGATYAAYIPGPEVAAINSNPVFNNLVPPFVCVNKPFTFDNSATDIDGDSLVYEVYTPLDGPFSPGTPAPQPPNNPPYSSVVWQAPYNAADMLGGTPLIVNSRTGLVSATPNTIGYFIIGLRVKEYRHGVFLSETRRDYQIVVSPCPTLVAAVAQVPQSVCGTTRVSFPNNSTGTNLKYNWYFGDPTSNADTSHLVTPVYVYPSKGTYSVTLVAYVSNKPDCVDTMTTTVDLIDYFKASFSFTPIACSDNLARFEGRAEAPPEKTIIWKWDFGDGGTSLAKDTIYRYVKPGIFPVKLISFIPNSLNCYDTLSAQAIPIYTNPDLYIPNTFTPNGDGHNDIFKVRGPSFGVYYFAVYNRWGELVYETNDPTQGWDGNHKGKPADSGVFGYYMRARCNEISEEIFRKGNVTLIR